MHRSALDLVPACTQRSMTRPLKALNLCLAVAQFVHLVLLLVLLGDALYIALSFCAYW